MPAVQPTFIEQFMVPMMIAMGILFFFVWRPQSKKIKEHETYLRDMKRGEEVITLSGLFGKVDGLTDSVVTLEIATGVKVKVLRKQIAGPAALALATKTAPTTPSTAAVKK